MLTSVAGAELSHPDLKNSEPELIPVAVVDLENLEAAEINRVFLLFIVL